MLPWKGIGTDFFDRRVPLSVLVISSPEKKKKKQPPNGSVKEDCALPSPVAKVNHSVHLPAPITGHGLATLTSGIVSLPSQKVA